MNEPMIFYAQFCTRCNISWVSKDIREICLRCNKIDKVIGVIDTSIMNTNPKKVIELVEEMTKAEILARLGNIACDIDWYSIYLKKKDELQQYLFGTSDYTTLGIQWGLLKQTATTKKKKQYKEEDLEL